MEFETSAIHSGQGPDPTHGDVAQALHLSTIFQYDAPGETRSGFEYIRYGNPTRMALEQCLGALEGAPIGCAALCFSSGMAATDCALRLLKPGDRLLIARDVYGGTAYLASTLLAAWGIEVAYADATDSAAFAAEITPGTRLVWIESPSNPLLRITDIQAVSSAAHAAGALVAIDSTFGTPYFQNPLAFGVDIVMHSATKYLAGHSDVLGGALIVRDPELRARLYAIQKATGAVASPFDSWLTLRGVRTLAVRMRQHEVNATAVARFLTRHKSVLAVHYPGSPHHPQHELACRQMRGFGGMVSFEVRGEYEGAYRFMERIKLFVLAASLGGVESIASYPPLMSHASLTEAEQLALGIRPGLLRLSVGLEDEADLIADLDQALD